MPQKNEEFVEKQGRDHCLLDSFYGTDTRKLFWVNIKFSGLCNQKNGSMLDGKNERCFYTFMVCRQRMTKMEIDENVKLSSRFKVEERICGTHVD